MESTTTLVNPTAIQLDFSKNSFTSATLSVSGIPLYRITTPDRAGQRTEVLDIHTKEPLITIKTRDLFPDTITFRYHNKGKSVGLKKWLTKNTLPNGSSTFSFDTDSGVYEWRPSPEHWVALYHTNNPVSPVAYLVKGHAAPSIFMEARTERFRDLILASMLVVERELKVVESWSWDSVPGQMVLNYNLLG